MTPLTELDRGILEVMAADERGQGRFTVTDGVAYLVGSGLQFPMARVDKLVARSLIRLLSARFIRDAAPGQPSQVLTMQISDLGREALAPKPKGT